MSIVNTYKSLDSFVKIEKAFKPELEKVELYLDEMIKNQPTWFSEVINHLVGAGGKRVRPLLVLLSYSLVSSEKANDDVIVMASIAEFVHTATLFHDDVIDDGDERRGKPTANKVYGNHTAILSGDFILGRVFQEINNLKKHEVLTAMIETVVKLVGGEIHQMDMKTKDFVSIADYEKLIYLKTASLFEWSMIAGAHAANVDKDTVNTLSKIGTHIGRIFQIVDDILDYTGNNLLGKKRLQDFNQGKITLPLLFLFSEEPNCFHQWKEVLKNKNEAELDKFAKKILQKIKEYEIQDKMKAYLQKDVTAIKTLINNLPDTKYKDYMNDLIEFLVSRMK